MAVPLKRSRDGLLPGLCCCMRLYSHLGNLGGSAFISLGTSENHLYIHVLSHIQYSMHSTIRLYAATLLTSINLTVKCCTGDNGGANNCGELSNYRTILRKNDAWGVGVTTLEGYLIVGFNIINRCILHAIAVYLHCKCRLAGPIPPRSRQSRPPS